jgi:hypothetical protein
VDRNRSVGSLRATLLVFIMAAVAPGAWAVSKYKVLYNFTSGLDTWREEFDPETGSPRSTATDPADAGTRYRAVALSP